MAALDLAIKKFFGSCLAAGQAYTTPPPGEVKLCYQDRFTTSSAYAFSDVYQNKDGTYLVQTDACCGVTECNSASSAPYRVATCRDLYEVYQELIKFYGREFNLCAELCKALHPEIDNLTDFLTCLSNFSLRELAPASIPLIEAFIEETLDFLELERACHASLDS